MVIALDKHKRPMGFVTPNRARHLLSSGRAVVHMMYPFTIRIKDVDSRLFEKQKEYHIKIDPGSKYTGIAIIEKDTNIVVFFAQIEHRGDAVRAALYTRNKVRRNRRNRETRYRHPKWDNKYKKKNSKYKAESPRPEGWLPPSVPSVADNIINWCLKLSKLINITKASIEYVKFDTQLMDNPESEGVEYQHGTLFGYEVKEYLLNRYGHVCQYCGGTTGDNILEWEHVISKHNGGTDKVSNAALACQTCNKDKDSSNLDQWLAKLKAEENPSELTKKRIECISAFLDGHPLKAKNYAAWVNSYRNYLIHNAFQIVDDIEFASGGRTKYNRIEVLKLPKDHHIDALCVGEVPTEGFKNLNQPVLYIKAQGRGNRLRGNTNACGVITKKYKDRAKGFIKRDKTGNITHSFMSGDIVKANVPKGKYAGEYTGRITIRKTGTFALATTTGQKFDVNYKYCKTIHRNDGYNYTFNKIMKGETGIVG